MKSYVCEFVIQGEFRAILCFASGPQIGHLNALLQQICPELRSSQRGHLKCAALPKLTHIIEAEEDHKHALVIVT